MNHPDPSRTEEIAFIASTNMGSVSWAYNPQDRSDTVEVSWSDQTGDWESHLLIGGEEYVVGASLESMVDYISQLIAALECARDTINTLHAVPPAPKEPPQTDDEVRDELTKF